MLRVAICDDDNIFVQRMLTTVKEEFAGLIRDETQIDCFVSGELLMAQHRAKPFDVVFLDIDMPQPDGFIAAKTISQIHECSIIFVTSHSELVYDSFMFKPLNFIYKGTDDYLRTRLKEVVRQIAQQIRQDAVVIINNRDERRHCIAVKNIVYIESSKHYLVIYTSDDQCIKYRGSITDAQQYYEQFDFVRIHRKYLANLKYVLNIDRSGKTVIFRQHFELPLGDIYKDNVDDRLTEYVRRIK